MENLNEVMTEEKKEVNPFEYVTIPVEKFEKLIKATAKKELKKKYKKLIKAIEDDKNTYERWYLEELRKRQDLEKKVETLQANLETAVEESTDDGDN